MTYPATHSIGSLFDDEPELEHELQPQVEFGGNPSSGSPSSTSSSSFPVILRSPVGIAGMCVAVLAGFYYLWPNTHAVLANQTLLTVVGSPVGRLQPDAVVSLAGIEVGRVNRVSVNDKVPTAEIRIDTPIANKLTGDSSFAVKALTVNSSGNVGLEITNGRLHGTHLPPVVQIVDETPLFGQSLDAIQNLLTSPDALSLRSPSDSPSMGTLLAAIASLIAVVVAGLKLMRGTIKAIVVPAVLGSVLIVSLLVIVRVQRPELMPEVLEWIRSSVQNPSPPAPIP